MRAIKKCQEGIFRSKEGHLEHAARIFFLKIQFCPNPAKNTDNKPI